MKYKNILKGKVSFLLKNGYVFLPELKWEFKDSDPLVSLLNNQNKTHIKDSLLHLNYLNNIECSKNLIPDLKRVAIDFLGINECKLKNMYCVTKIVKSFQVSVSDTPHFDSHIFTLVTPVSIPQSLDIENCGQLIMFNKFRPEPTNEFINFFSKFFYYFFLSSPPQIQKLRNKKSYVEFDFKDLIPVVFLGRQNLHFSRPFKSLEDKNHILLITHFFDPSPFWSIGYINRYIRNR
jgi:hypothetical protein